MCQKSPSPITPNNNVNTHFNHFDKKCLENLQSIVFQTNSMIVISSTWRNSSRGMSSIFQQFKKYDLHKKIIGRTPNLSSILYSKHNNKKVLQIMRTYNVMEKEMKLFETPPNSTFQYDLRGVEIFSFLKSIKNKYFKGNTDKYLTKSFQNSPLYNTKVENFVILDDENDMGALLPLLIQCNAEVGLTQENANNAIRILNSKTNLGNPKKINYEKKQEMER